MEEIDTEMVYELRATANAIKEGTTTVQETFIKPVEEKAAAAKAKEKAEDAKKRAEAAINRSTNKVLTHEAQTQQNKNSK